MDTRISNINEDILKKITDKITERILSRVNFSEIHEEMNKKAKRVVLISPDFYPRVVSPISYTVKRISEGLADKGVEVHLIAFDPLKSEQNEIIGGVNIHYIGNKVRSYSPLTWSLTLSMDVNRKVADIFHNNGPIDLIHAHDWTTFPSALTLRDLFKRPLLSNYYSLEIERSNGIENLYTSSVKNIEWRAGVKSEKIYVKDEHMRDTMTNNYNIPLNKISLFDPYDPNSFKLMLKDYNTLVRDWFNAMSG